eukprot:CAMPEP_0118903464 /NCGR_PEP_ID=MMETSP1166-20130328/8317_1 /TAXON_ID=1104430 /ORGANISM="Chrysoreinhardia sp, Strain CCMP3193" /LENGTH=238 /DNA_ID=CAMNT_0006842691 /DNA_START=12 /DNA_END=728 /DNA_ORIENTATION=+
MPLADGTNAEKEDPSPPLGWSSKADLKDVKLYGMKASPPCAKLIAILKYYEVPFEVVSSSPGTPVTKGGSYKKIPVLTASGRQVNDSYVIVKSLLEPLSKDFDAELEQTITFGFQPAIEAEAFGVPEDFRKYAVNAGFSVAAYVPGFILGMLSPASTIKKKHPDMKPCVDYGKDFLAKMDGKPFWGGDEPGAHDITMFGTLHFFVKSKCDTAATFLTDSGLADWYKNVQQKMPENWDE